MKFKYHTTGTCSRTIEFEINNGILNNVVFYGGCDGNLKGVCALVDGRPATEVITCLKGIRCGLKSTSCPDQLATAIEQALSQ
ncbi:MAG: TIGR03905 family TSCPD domain-containing protein [Muribaculaceae bacterium]|nr:TIGR03905 family TSCPD domain-containing protein [Muribaculaceae bacterium]